MKDMNGIRKFIETRRSTESLVLCTLVRKSGSSYRGVGAKKVVSLLGDSLGFLSGGCLEASIEKAARERFNELPFIASFSTLAEEDRLLGYQTGCQGVIDILFEDALGGDLNLLLPYGENPKHNYVRVDLSADSVGRREAVTARSSEEDVIFEAWQEPVKLYIIGCGADADIYGSLAESMGWSVCFIDYRGSLMTPGRFGSHPAVTMPAEKMGSVISEGDRTAVVLMTHNFEADLEILRALKNHRVGYLGCLGPAVRYERLKNDLQNMYGETIPARLNGVAYAPAGIFTHGQSPEDIALSVVAQIQGELIEKPKDKAWTLILAAGASSRFGSAKALAEFKGITMLDRALRTARELSGDRVLVVSGAHDFEPYLAGVHHVRNERWRDGMGSSIAAGVGHIQNLDPKAAMIALLPVDQPLVTAVHLRGLIEDATRSRRCALTSSGPVIGPPAAIPKRFFPQALKLEGENGLKSVLRADQMIFVEEPAALTDIDSPADLLQL